MLYCLTDTFCACDIGFVTTVTATPIRALGVDAVSISTNSWKLQAFIDVYQTKEQAHLSYVHEK